LAKITGYERSVGLQPSNTQSPELSSAGAQELEHFGASVSDLGGMLVQRAQQREDFDAENNYRRFGLEMSSELDTRTAEITPGGKGFHDNFMSEVYAPKREAFLSSLPDRLRPKFETILADGTGADTAKWSIDAATTERNEVYRFQKAAIGDASTELVAGIELHPENYDAYLERGRALIDTSSLPTPEKEQMKETWSQVAMQAMLDQMLNSGDPQDVIRVLGGDPRNLSPTTQFAMLSRAVQWQESRDNPDAVSGKGAVGLMQVTPSTAAEIAKAIGDPNFPPPGAPEAVVRAYLSNPYVNKRYGEFYLQQQLRAFAGTRNPIEAALVAYNAGPGVAQKWVESGYNDSLLPKETRDYKKAVMDTMTAPAAKGSAKDVKWTGADTAKTNPDLVARVTDAFATVGLSSIKVNSADRDAMENRRAGGAEHSQHLDGNALDLDVRGLSIPQRLELIKSLSAAGVTGIGVYANTIHADLGGRRAWGPDHHFGSVPKWASAVIAEHLAGTTPPPRAVGSRFAGLQYDKRQQYLSSADQAIVKQQSAALKSSAVEKVQIKQQMDNQLALIRATGHGTEDFDQTAVSTILGEDDYLTFMHKADVAQRSYTATDGIATMAPEDMEQRFKEYEPIPGATDFADQQQVQAAVQKEVERVTTLRAHHPDQAAMEFPDVKEAWAALQKADGEPPADQVQAFVKLMLEKQSSFDVPPKAQAPVPREWALEIGRSLTRTPELTGKNLADVKASVILQYTSLAAVFGDYTDEVLSYSLSQYKGLSKPMADLLSGYVTQLQTRTGIFRPAELDSAADAEQVNQFSFGSFSGVPLVGPLFSGLDALSRLTGGAPPEDDGLSPEERLRAAGASSEEE
jgi:uncharacterized protein YcbK (DUF882 family)